MAHNPQTETVTIKGTKTMNMEIELPYFFQEKRDYQGPNFRTFKMTPRPPERFPENLVKMVLNVPETAPRVDLEKKFHSRITKVELIDFDLVPQSLVTTYETKVGGNWEIRIFFEHPEN